MEHKFPSRSQIISHTADSMVLDQHKERKKQDKKISDEGIDSKVKQVSDLVTDHIVRGNEIKLLTAGGGDDVEDETEDATKEIVRRELRQEHEKISNLLRNLPEKERNLLLDKYTSKPDGE